MADPFVVDVLAGAAALLGDDAQQQFTNAVLLPWYGFAFREVYDICRRWRLPLGKRQVFVYLPAFSSIFVPEAQGINDFSEPMSVWERGNLLTATVNGATNATPTVVSTAAPNSFSSNFEVELTGIVGPVGINDQWFISVVDNQHFSLNESTAMGAYSSGGTAIQSPDIFVELDEVNTLPQYTPTSQLGFYKWENQRFYFLGANQARELRIEYVTSGNPPQTGNVGIENSYNFLAQRTAGLIAAAYDMPQTAEKCNMEALGPSLTPDGTGGQLRNLVGPMLLEKQNTTKRPATFRPRRNVITRTIW